MIDHHFKLIIVVCKILLIKIRELFPPTQLLSQDATVPIILKTIIIVQFKMAVKIHGVLGFWGFGVLTDPDHEG